MALLQGHMAPMATAVVRDPMVAPPKGAPESLTMEEQVAAAVQAVSESVATLQGQSTSMAGQVASGSIASMRAFQNCCSGAARTDGGRGCASKRRPSPVANAAIRQEKHGRVRAL